MNHKEYLEGLARRIHTSTGMAIINDCDRRSAAKALRVMSELIDEHEDGECYNYTSNGAIICCYGGELTKPICVWCKAKVELDEWRSE